MEKYSVYLKKFQIAIGIAVVALVVFIVLIVKTVPQIQTISNIQNDYKYIFRFCILIDRMF